MRCKDVLRSFASEADFGYNTSSMLQKENSAQVLAQVHGGLYVVRENSVTNDLLRPARRLPFGDVTISTDPGRGLDVPRLRIKVNADWSMTVDTQGSRRGLGIVSFPVLRARRGEVLTLGDESPLVDFTIKPTEDEDLAVLINPRSLDGLHRTRIVFVAPKLE